MRVALINKFGPPSDAPTARVIAQLAEALEADGHEVEIIATRGEYKGSRRGISRAAGELLSLGSMFGRLLFSRRADRWVALSSPPGLLVPVAIAATLRGVQLSHWVMDLYPETAVAFGVLREGSFMERAARAVLNWATRRCRSVYLLDTDMQERWRAGLLPRLGERSPQAAQKHCPPNRVLPLWPLEPIPPDSTLPARKCWIYSGNLGRAHEWGPLLDIQKQVELVDSEIRLIFQARGGELQPAKHRANELNLARVDWNDFLPAETFRETIGTAGALVATQRLEARGCVWPSKLAVAARIARPLLWIGPADGAVAVWLKDRPATGIFLPEETDDAAKWLLEWCGREMPATQWQEWLAKLPLPTPREAARQLVEPVV